MIMNMVIQTVLLTWLVKLDHNLSFDLIIKKASFRNWPFFIVLIRRIHSSCADNPDNKVVLRRSCLSVAVQGYS